MAILTVKPQANVATVAGNTRLAGGAGGALWSGTRSQTSQDAPEFPTGAQTIFQGEDVGSINIITRAIFTFDTSALGSGATIILAEFKFYSAASGDNSETINPANGALVGATPSNTTTFAASDFSQVDTTRFCDTDVTIAAFIATSGYHTWTLNAAGLAAINKTGVTKLAIRASNDFSDATAPSARSYALGYYAENADAAKHPVLEITYTTASGLSGIASVTLAPLMSSSAAALTISGTGSTTLAPLTSSSVAALAISGSASKTLAALTASATASLAIAASHSVTLAPLTSTAIGNLTTTGIEGNSSITLAPLTSSSAAALAISGIASKTLAALTASATASLAISASHSVTLAPLTSTAIGSLATSGIEGNSSITLSPLTSSSVAALVISGFASKTLAALVSSSTSALSIAAAASKILAALTSTASAFLGEQVIDPGVIASETPGRNNPFESFGNRFHLNSYQNRLQLKPFKQNFYLNKPNPLLKK